MPRGWSAWTRVALGVLVSLLAGIAIRQHASLSNRQTEIVQLTAENQQLHRKLGHPTNSADQPPALSPPASTLSPTRPAPRTNKPAADATAEYSAVTEGLRDTLAQANANVVKFEGRIADLESQIETLTADNRRLSAAGEDLKRGVAEANQTSEALRAELKAKATRAEELEAANMRLEQQSLSGKQSVTQFRQLATDLEGIFRRREMYLNNVLSRYKDVTEQYRALSGVRDSRPDREAAPSRSAEIDRIQNSISLAEEDLKQIQALSAQGARLQKKLP